MASRMLQEAALQALVRFGPQFDALDQLTRQAKQTYNTTVGAADVSSASTRAAVEAARPDVAGIYDHATAGQGALRAGLASALGGLSGPGTDLIKAAALSEAGNAQTHIRESKIAAMTALTNRGLQADEGRAQAVLAAGARLHQDIASIGQSRVSLAGQKGAFKAATLGGLQDKADQRSFTAAQNAASRRNARTIAAGRNATSRANTRDSIAAREQIAQQRAAQKRAGAKWQSPAEHGKARDTIEAALSQAKTLQAAGRALPEVRQLLVNGRPTTSVKDDKGNTLKVPGISAVPQLYANVALDLLTKGYVSPRSRQLLNQRGLTVRGLGLPVPPPPRVRRQQAQAHAGGAALGMIGQLAHALGL